MKLRTCILRRLASLVAAVLPGFSAYSQLPGYIVENFKVEDGLSGNTPNAILCDKEGYIWIGNDGFIDRYNGVYFKNYDIHQDERVSDLLQDEEGTIIAKCNNRLFAYDPQNDCFQAYENHEHFDSLIFRLPGISPKERCTRIGKWIFTGDREKAMIFDTERQVWHNPDWTSIHDAALDREGKIWLTTNNGLYIVDNKLNVLQHICKNSADKYALQDNSLYSVAIDPYGGVWVTSYFEGLFHFSRNDADIIRHSNILQDNTSLRVRNIVEDRYGDLWIGTEDRGLIKYDKKRGTYTRINIPSKSNNIVSLHCKGDSIWVKTFNPDSEYCRLHVRSLKGEAAQSMPSEYIRYNRAKINKRLSAADYGKFYHYRRDSKGNMWATSSLGLLCINADSTGTHFFTRADGLQFDSFNYASLFCASDSLMYAGTTDGFITFNPDKMLSETDSVTIHISGIEHQSHTIRIAHKNNSLDISAVTLDYRTPRRTWLQYNIKGGSENWKDVAGGHITLRNLKNGRYCLRIRALTGDGSKTIAEWQQDFRILPPPALSWWAILLYIISGSLIALIIIKAVSRNEIMRSKVSLAGDIASRMRHPFALVQIQMETLSEHFKSSSDKQFQGEINAMSENLEKINLMLDNITELRSTDGVDRFLSGKKIEQETKLPDITVFDATILVVSSSEDIYNFICRIVGDNFNILYADTAEKAMNMLEQQKISLILIDNVEPDSINDGIELCHRIKTTASTAHKPVIMISTGYDITSKVRALSSGVDAYLINPLSRDILIATIKGILDNRNAIRAHYAQNPAVDTVRLANRAPDNVLMRSIQDYIIKNLDNSEMKVEDVAKANNVSLPKLQKKMKAIMNMSPSEYILNLRLKKAEELIMDNNLSIAEISERTGFSSHSYFTSCFRKHFGYTPMQFREKK